jgi:transcriptional regulator with XRE-family HTH domain
MEKSSFTREYKVLCRLLRECREDHAITQVQLAERLGETQSEISKFERGERRLDLVQLYKWCQAIGVRASEFVRSFEDSIPKRRA